MEGAIVMITSPWDLTEAQRLQIREAHAEEKRRKMELAPPEPRLTDARRIASLEEYVVGAWALLTGKGDPDEASRDWIRENLALEVEQITQRRPDMAEMLED